MSGDDVDLLFGGIEEAARALKQDDGISMLGSEVSTPPPEMEESKENEMEPIRDNQRAIAAVVLDAMAVAYDDAEEESPEIQVDSRKPDPRSIPLWKLRMPKGLTLTDVCQIDQVCEKALPPTYNFDVHRTVHKIRRMGCKHVGLQLPDGLLLYASTLAEIIEYFCGCQTTVLGDVVYGACCIDDLTSRALGIDFMVHYGHSCLVPVDQTAIPTHYAIVEIMIDVPHLADSIQANVKPGSCIALMSTVQFAHALSSAKEILQQAGFSVVVPQEKPLSGGEVLGCTSPSIIADIIVFVADGRFHLEASMMANPGVPAYRYDPYCRRLLYESLDEDELARQRGAAVARALSKPKGETTVGLILGTLGRQGSVGILEAIQSMLDSAGVKHFTCLMSNISVDKLAMFAGSADAWVQVACPRLSIDWGEYFEAAPLLSPYEAFQSWGGKRSEMPDDHPIHAARKRRRELQECKSGCGTSACGSGAVGPVFDHPMDYYSNEGGVWANYGGKEGFGGSQKFTFWHMGPGRVEESAATKRTAAGPMKLAW